MNNRFSLAAALSILTLLLGLSGCATQTPSPHSGFQMINDQDHQAIQDVLDNYTRSVSTGDQALFESQLLDEKIPFYGLGLKLTPAFKPSLDSVQDYARFRQGVFLSGKQYKQRFFDVTIQQDGDLAQASLTFETTVVESGNSVQGWKILQLLKVAGHWKIASEFWTVH